MTAAVLAIRRVERQREPDLGVRVVNVEPRRHDAEYGSLAAVEIDLLADDRRITAERALPELVRQEGDRLAVRQVVLLREHAPTMRRDTERLEQGPCGADAGYALRRVALAQVHRGCAIRADLGERLRALPELEILRR